MRFVSKKIYLYTTLFIYMFILYACIASRNNENEAIKQDTLSSSWTQIFLGNDYNRTINYENYSDANHYGDESKRRILWQNNNYTILGAVSDIDTVYMESIEIIDIDTHKYNFPRDIMFAKNIVNGEAVVMNDDATLYIGSGYEMQTLPNNESYDFTGDGMDDIFFGINQSGSKSMFEYYVLTMNEETQTLECIGFQIGSSWVPHDYITNKIPVGYAVDMLYYIIYPIKEYDSASYQLRQVFRLYSQTDFETQSMSQRLENIKGVFILDWQYQDTSWNIVGSNVNLTGKIQLGAIQ